MWRQIPNTKSEDAYPMERLTAYVSGNVQKVGYRKRIIDIARAFGLKGMIENLDDGGVKIIAEGDDEKLNSLSMPSKSLK